MISSFHRHMTRTFVVIFEVFYLTLTTHLRLKPQNRQWLYPVCAKAINWCVLRVTSIAKVFNPYRLFRKARTHQKPEKTSKNRTIASHALKFSSMIQLKQSSETFWPPIHTKTRGIIWWREARIGRRNYGQLNRALFSRLSRVTMVQYWAWQLILANAYCSLLLLIRLSKSGTLLVESIGKH